MELPEDYEGFITPEGELVSIEDSDRMFSIITRGVRKLDDILASLRGLALQCYGRDRIEAACGYLEKELALAEKSGDKASCLVVMGLAREKARDFKAAVEAYSRAFEMPQERNETWYWLNNNLAYCLNMEHRYEEAERHCRAAIKIDPGRHNAHKNLGIALQGLERYAAAAKSFLRATRLCPADVRARDLLEELLVAHAEVLEENPGILAQLNDCHEAVRSIKGRLRPQ